MNWEKAYWSVVAECLRVFHGRTLATAEAIVLAQWMITEKTPESLVYHLDPFEVACGLARHQLDVEDHDRAYQDIRDRYFQVYEQLVAV